MLPACPFALLSPSKPVLTRKIMLSALILCSRHSLSARHAIRLRVFSSTSNSPAPTKSEIEELRKSIQTLQQLVQQTKTDQSKNIERLARQLESQSKVVEQSLDELHNHLGTTFSLERVSAAAKDYVEKNETIRSVLDQFNRQVDKHPRFINRYTLGAVLLSLAILWRYRVSIRRKTSKEVAEIASQTLQQETLRQSIQETLEALATSPETLETLNDLIRKLIQEPSTQEHLVKLVQNAVATEEVQNALMELLQNVFQDPHLQELSGEFLLKGLDVEHVRKMLEAQTQSLVRETVLDESVQQATAKGVKKSLWYALKPY
jgi:DNA repair exonuclease SbcCD ATPase subunit